MDWYKEHGNSDNHPQIRKAGFWGAQVFRALCRVNTEYDLDGEIPAQYVDPEWLADRLKLTEHDCISDAPENILALGLSKCVKAGLVRHEADGPFILDGWLRKNPPRDGPLSGAERMQKLRARQSDVTPRDEGDEMKTSQTSQASRDEIVSSPNVTRDGASRNVTVTTEEIRGEEKRLEKKRGEETFAPFGANLPPNVPTNVQANVQPKVPETLGQTISDDLPPSKAEVLQVLWNAEADPAFPRWKVSTDKRRKAAIARFKERPIEGDDGWRAVIRRMNASPFLKGVNDRNWIASPDWLLKPDSANKVLEGQYDGKRTAGPSPNSLPVADGREGRSCEACGSQGQGAAPWEHWLCYPCQAEAPEGALWTEDSTVAFIEQRKAAA